MKKKLSFFLYIVVFGLFCNCGDPDDLYRDIKYLNVKNLIQIETANSYKLNDFLVINASFSRYLPEPRFTDLLDIYKTSRSTEYEFKFTLEKKSAYGTWTTINFGGKIVPSKGKTTGFYGNSGICVLNSQNERYEFRAGLPLLETGDFRLKVSNQISDGYSSNSPVSIYITTTIEALDTQGYYSFSVK
jgi:hypothetical protein